MLHSYHKNDQHHHKHHSKNTNQKHPGHLIRPAHDVYPEDIECVFEGKHGKGAIYIGNLEAAENLETLKKHKIESLLTACKNIHIKHPKEHVPFYLYIPGEDHQNYDLSVHFDTAIDFIHKSLQKTNILVHCMAGVSRSVTLVLAYLMKHKNMTYSSAHAHVRSKRRIINPNKGFIKQLTKYEKQLQRQRHAARRSCERITTKTSFYQNESTTKDDISSYQPQNASTTLGKSRLDFNSRYNPEVEFNRYNPKSYNSMKNSFYQAAPRSKAYEELPNNFEGKKVLQNSQGNVSLYPRENNYMSLSKELDDRIAKIRQKYNDCTSELLKNRENMRKTQDASYYDQNQTISHDPPTKLREKHISSYEPYRASYYGHQLRNNSALLTNKEFLKGGYLNSIGRYDTCYKY